MSNFLSSGDFVIGCNYWASHAGMFMWRDWSAEAVREDLDALAAQKLTVLRVFPLWPDFQPLHSLTSSPGRREIRFGEEPLPDTDAGRAGVDEVMMRRFAEFADLAHERGFSLIVGLVTGWMSGRMFVPPAFIDRNLLNDPEVVKWQVRFVRHFVKTLRGHPAVAAWDLGNECNCMAPLTSSDEAWNWTHAIASAIRLEDPDRPVVSGMHSLALRGVDYPWTMADQGELTDILTTHPYPLFTPYCDREALNEQRNGLHATAQSVLYSELTGKPCLPEEVGSLGPMVCSAERAAAYIRTALYSCWAHDLRGFLWWCGFDQDRLERAPYDWTALERELGLMTATREPKPVIREMAAFREALDALPFKKLPPRRVDGMCILCRDTPETWGTAFASFILAKRAGFDLGFQDAAGPLREADFYLMPSIRGSKAISRRRYLALLERVKAGATLLATLGDGMVQPFADVFGVEVDYRRGGRYVLKALDAEVLEKDGDGKPLFTSHAYGKGKALLLNRPMESELVGLSGGFEGDDHGFYARAFAESPAAARRVLSGPPPEVGVTEHAFADGSVVAVLVNYSTEPLTVDVRPREGWRVDAYLRGGPRIPGNDAAVLRLVV